MSACSNQLRSSTAVLCVKFYHELLAKERRLTSDDEKTKIETITVAPAEGNRKAQLIYTDIESSRELEYYASKCKNLTGPVLSFVIMQPVYPWGQLQISDEVLKKLLTFNKNSPLLLDVINLFGDHIETANEEFPVYWEEYKPDKVPAENQIDPFVSRTTEVGYNIKYAVNLQHLIKCTNMIWVTRKMGVSAKHFVDAGNTAWNFIQPCSLFVERLKRVVEQDKDRNWPRRHDIEIHLLAFESANQNWTSYITYLEGKYIGMNAAAFCWRPSVKDDLAYMQNPESQGLQFTDTQTLQCLKDKLLQISYALEINHGNLNSLRNGWSRLYKKHKRRNEIDARFANLLLIIHQQKSRANSLIERCTSLQSLIPAMLARRENAVMRMLSEKSMENSRSMKVITIFTLCYLPPSFVATFFVNWHTSFRCPLFSCYLHLVLGDGGKARRAQK
ncbi:hypothetical protein EDC01DRAFT_426933 [Geopyxis carbonaria]|nr:hypothetical protein EDC01DRAFT_426933 [Geopyxis carbonaria]